MSDLPHYVQEVQNAGITVSRFEARRFRVFLVNYTLFKEFVDKKLSGAGAEKWMLRLTEGSDGFLMSVQAGKKAEALVVELINELRDILDLDRKEILHRPEDLSKWMLKWVSDDGLKRTRMHLNTQVSNARQERVAITCYASTRDRLMEATKKGGHASIDDYINSMLDLTGEM